MELLADLFDLQYFMYKEINPDKHVILVKNTQNGSGAYMILETGELLESDLDRRSTSKVKGELPKYRGDFLNYWNKIKKEWK